jgi:phage gpG-like protein
VRIIITAQGLDYMEKDIMASSGRARFLKPALEKVADDMMRVTRLQFLSQGRRGGGSWAELSEGWALAKAKRGLDPRILFAKHPLVDSLTDRGDPNQILEITNKGIRYGSSVPYADVHQYGSARVPARPFIQFVAGDYDRWSEIITGYIVDPMKRRRSTGRA